MNSLFAIGYLSAFNRIICSAYSEHVTIYVTVCLSGPHMFRVASSLVLVCDYLLITAVGRSTALQAGRPRVRYPTGSIVISHWLIPSGRTMTLESTQPLTEMSTMAISCGVKAAGA